MTGQFFRLWLWNPQMIARRGGRWGIGCGSGTHEGLQSRVSLRCLMPYYVSRCLCCLRSPPGKVKLKVILLGRAMTLYYGMCSGLGPYEAPKLVFEEQSKVHSLMTLILKVFLSSVLVHKH